MPFFGVFQQQKKTTTKHLLVANLPVTLRYIIVICPGIRSESNLFQTFRSLAGMKHAIVLTYHLFFDGKYTSVALNIYLKSARCM